MTGISTITITLGLTLLTIIPALSNVVTCKKAQAEKDSLKYQDRLPLWSDWRQLLYIWYLWRRLLWNSVLALGLQHWLMPCTWQGGHFLIKCTALSCSGRGLGLYALIYSQPRYRLARTLLGPLLSYLASHHSTWPRSEFHLYIIRWSKVCIKQTHFLASPVHWPANYKNCRYAYGVGRCLCQGIQLVEGYSWLGIATFLNLFKEEDSFEEDCGIFPMAWRRDRKILIKNWRRAVIRRETDRDEFYKV